MRKSVSKWIWIVSTVTVIMAVLFFMALPAAAAPAVSVTEPVFEFSQVQEGVDVTHDFILENTGDTTLEIIKVAPG